jgi:hypothetical protein
VEPGKTAANTEFRAAAARTTYQREQRFLTTQPERRAQQRPG